MRQSSENFELRIERSKHSRESWQGFMCRGTCGAAQPSSFVSFLPPDIVALIKRNTLLAGLGGSSRFPCGLRSSALRQSLFLALIVPRCLWWYPACSRLITQVVTRKSLEGPGVAAFQDIEGTSASREPPVVQQAASHRYTHDQGGGDDRGNSRKTCGAPLRRQDGRHPGRFRRRDHMPVLLYIRSRTTTVRVRHLVSIGTCDSSALRMRGCCGHMSRRHDSPWVSRFRCPHPSADAGHRSARSMVRPLFTCGTIADAFTDRPAADR